MVIVTGDIHGEIGVGRLGSKKFCADGLTKKDYVVICGDFGFVWDGGATDKWWLKWLNDKPWTTLFVDGNHENHDMLESMKIEKWNGGKVHKVSKSIIHLMRGQVYSVEGKKWFTFGGAKSQDIERRVEGKSWWVGEMASEQEYEEARRNLAANGWKVDYVFTHCAPTWVCPGYEADRMTSFLEGIASRLEFDKWFFGHYHKDFQVGNMYGLYTDFRVLS